MLDAAYHEAGHAVIASLLGLSVARVSVQPTGIGGCGSMEFAPRPGSTPPTRDEIRSIMIASFGGPLAEARFSLRQDRHVLTENGPDREHIVHLAVCLRGTADDMDAEIWTARCGAQGMIGNSETWAAIGRAAVALVVRRTLSGNDIHQVLTAAFRSTHKL